MDIKELLTLLAVVIGIIFTYGQWRSLPNARKQRLKQDLDILKLHKDLDLPCDDIAAIVEKEKEEIYSDRPIKLPRIFIVGIVVSLIGLSLFYLYLSYTLYERLGVWGGLSAFVMVIITMKIGYDYYLLLPKKKDT